ncbi:MAG: DinB family protein [Saprospiraceae bacterium]
MTPTKWIDRQFEFNAQENILPVVVERLWGTPLRLHYKLKTIPLHIHLIQPEGKWSILEHIGHLTDLETLWQIRLQDILNHKEVMTPWDVTNAKTSEANHNSKTAETLIAEFTAARQSTLDQLSSLNEEDAYKSSLHPRLHTPMRLMDLCWFVAEHDDHHLANITTIYKLFTTK